MKKGTMTSEIGELPLLAAFIAIAGRGLRNLVTGTSQRGLRSVNFQICRVFERGRSMKAQHYDSETQFPLPAKRPQGGVAWKAAPVDRRKLNGKMRRMV